VSYHIFISYPRIADKRGHVSDIRAHLERELQIKTGDKDLVVFQDRSKLEGGDRWSEKLENELQVADAFLLLLSPLWLTSNWCRKELQVYLSHGPAKEIERPIIPLLWDETESTDARTKEEAEILAMIKTRQIVRWDELRHQNSSYPGYYAAISKLAQVIKHKLQAKSA
jgi:TIR domain